jgi:hypothetical protein
MKLLNPKDQKSYLVPLIEKAAEEITEELKTLSRDSRQGGTPLHGAGWLASNHKTNYKPVTFSCSVQRHCLKSATLICRKYFRVHYTFRAGRKPGKWGRTAKDTRGGALHCIA